MKHHDSVNQQLRCCSDNYIGALGASVLANALAKNKSLRELHLKGNELGNEGVKAICAALRERQAPVTSLDFGNNKCAARRRPDGNPALLRAALQPRRPAFVVQGRHAWHGH